VFTGENGIFTKIGNAIKNVNWGSILEGFASAFGFARGGPVRGPGTSRSDSIPAMLSNGEYVVNARSASMFRPLLHAINNGSPLGFASGGMVGTTGANTVTPGLVTNQGLVATMAPVVNQLSSTDQTIAGSVQQLGTDTNRAFKASFEATNEGFKLTQTSITTLANGVNQEFLNRDVAAAHAAVKSTKFNWVMAAIKIAGAVFGAYSSISGALAGSGSFINASGLGAGVEISKIPAPPKIEVRALARGGPVWGAGTATSDSIHAMLSNGEYVINAKSTAKFRGLLEGINSGKVNFKDGGYVDSGNDTLSKAVEKRNKEMGLTQNHDTTVNISITGDISRQTRLEVLKMLPQISTGVQQIAYEKGRR
jgi:hypothetical protein